MANLLYSWPTDNVTAEGTLTVEVGTPEPLYPAANLTDLNPARPCKLQETTGAFLWDFGSAQRVDLVAIIHHNLEAGLAVRIQANDTDDWGSPEPALDTTIVIPTWWEDGMPVNPLLDLTSTDGYSTSGYQYWRLAIDQANADPIAIGEVVLLDRVRRMTQNPLWGLDLAEHRPIIEHTTDYMVPTVYSYGVSRRGMTGSLITTPAGAEELRAWYRACLGRTRPFLFQLEGGDVNDCWLARFVGQDLSLIQDGPNCFRATLAFEEVTRGLPL
jgi:hypothetical protein